MYLNEQIHKILNLFHKQDVDKGHLKIWDLLPNRQLHITCLKPETLSVGVKT